jgi:hypothetical protein
MTKKCIINLQIVGQVLTLLTASTGSTTNKSGLIAAVGDNRLCVWFREKGEICNFINSFELFIL